MLVTILIAGIIAGLMGTMGWYKSALGGFIAVAVAVMAYRGVVLQDPDVWTDALFCLLLLPIGWYGATNFHKLQSTTAS
jgi:hypothetical protein